MPGIYRVARLRAAVDEVPHLVLHHRAADRDVQVVHVVERRHARPVVGLELLAGPAVEHGAVHLVAAGLRDDVHDETGRLGLAESAGRGERNLLRVADVGHVRWRLAAAGRVAHIQAIHPHAALVGPSPMNRELRRHRACGGIVDVGEDAWHHRHHRSVVALTGDRSDDVVVDRRLAPGALHVDDGGGAGDGDGLLQPAHAHVGVHRRGERPGQLDAFASATAET